MLVTVQTGLRVSELITLRRNDIHLGAGAHVACHGKGRKDRITPLTKPAVQAMCSWPDECSGTPTDPVFPTRTGRSLSRNAIERRLTRHHATAARMCPSLNGKHITADALRHTVAVRLLEAGVVTTVIALWLGHEPVDTTALYLHAHLDIKEKPSPASPRHTPSPDVTTRQTRYWRSSKDSDYADFPCPSTPTNSGFTTKVGIRGPSRSDPLRPAGRARSLARRGSRGISGGEAASVGVMPRSGRRVRRCPARWRVVWRMPVRNQPG
jgi:hypothetical protein